LALAGLVCTLPGAGARAEALHRLMGGEICTRFTGYVLTDDTHRRETYV